MGVFFAGLCMYTLFSYYIFFYIVEINESRYFKLLILFSADLSYCGRRLFYIYIFSLCEIIYLIMILDLRYIFYYIFYIRLIYSHIMYM